MLGLIRALQAVLPEDARDYVYAGATVRGQCGRHFDEFRLVAHAGQDERDGLGGQPLDERPPDPTVGAGDEHGGAGQVHLLTVPGGCKSGDQYSSRYS